MDKFKLLTQYSPWFILLCLLAGFGYAWLLYNKKSPWSKKINNVLAGGRFILVALLCFLLLGPFLKSFKNYIEKPVMVFAIDNSQSVSIGTDTNFLNSLKSKLADIAKDLSKEDVDVDIQLLNKASGLKELPGLKFDNSSTNLNQLLNDIQSNYENRNLSGAVLISDGIYNQGISPNYNQYNFPLYTVGLGDTVPKKDINLKAIYYNKISYAGNKFPVLAEIQNHGFKGQNVNVSLKQAGKVLESKIISFSKESELQEIEFYISSVQKGLQHYTIEAAPLPGEFTTKNNVQHAYVDIIDGKENILLVALTPHPDIKAIKSAIEKKENYQLDIYIPGINELNASVKYDLVIFHQLPDMSGMGRNVIEKFTKDNTSILYIIGSQTNIVQLNSLNNILNINARPGHKDKVTPSLNKDYDKFKIENEEAAIINSYPPLSVNFGEYTVKDNSDVVLYQKVGTTVSTKPLLVINAKKDKKTGILCGEGIWEWRLREFQDTKDTKVFDKFVSSLLQYLSSKEDKRKFRVYPVNNEFLVSDKILFEAETYNDIYEKIYGQKIDLKITNEKGKTISYTFVNSEGNSKFEAKGLEQGVYKYLASTKLGGKIESSAGEFTVREVLLEVLNTTADFDILKALAAQTKGKFYLAKDLNLLGEELGRHTGKSIIHSNEEFVELINLPFIFFFLLLLASGEWFLRRYKGGY
jgi:hypothetical protein